MFYVNHACVARLGGIGLNYTLMYFKAPSNHKTVVVDAAIGFMEGDTFPSFKVYKCGYIFAI